MIALILVSVCVTIIVVTVGVLFATGTFAKSEDVSASTPAAETAPVATGGNASSPPPALKGTSAIQLGDMGLGPWGSASNFVDMSAKWIWNTQTATVDAPNTPVKFSNQWYNIMSSNVPATLHIIVDNKATVMLNGKQIADVEGGWDTTNYPKVNLTLVPGNNVIDIIATNAGGAAALIASLVKNSDSSIIMRTDSSWVTNTV